MPVRQESVAIVPRNDDFGPDGDFDHSELFENAFHHAPIGLALVDLKGRLMKVNRSFCRMIGYEEHEALSLDFQSITHPDDLAPDLERLERLTAGEIPSYSLDKRYIRKDGSEVWGSLSVSMVVDDQGRPKHYISQITDLTERRRAAVALTSALEAANNSAREARAAEKVLSALVQAIPISVVMTDRNLNVLKVSPGWLDHFGRDETAAVGKDLCAMLDGFYAPFRPIFERALAGEPTKNPHRRIEWKGRVGFFQTEVTPWRDANGEVGGILITAYNITSLVEALERSERSEQRLAMAVRLADLHVWEIDYKRKTLECFGPQETFFDRPLTYDEVAADLMCGIHPEDKPAAMARWKDRDAAVDGEPMVYRTARADGREVWAASAARLIRDEEGTPERVVGMFHNVTTIKAAERASAEARDLAEAANRSKSEFLANMSHEIRTPLNGILGMTQVIEQDELSDAQRERIKVVRESGVTLLGILNDVLDLSKIQAGRLELEPAPFDIADLTAAVTGVFAGTAAAKDISLDAQIDRSAEGVWIGDSLRLRQILSNLVSNGLKFTGEGGVTVQVRHESGALVLAVKDTGIGIAGDKIDTLFEKFSQEDASTTRRYGGTGLGLSICRELVELMDGRIEVESEKGVGSCFSVHLPLPRGDRAAATGARPARREESARGEAPLKVLAAEDNMTNQLVLRSLLAPVGVDLTLVADGAEAVEAFRAGDFDVILMDIQMPVMNGVEATLAIRALEEAEGRRRTPILSLSANAMTHQVEDYVAAGMDGSVAKPIEVEKLYAALDQVLGE
jgi:PAS domain S-box-containing protein